MNTTKNKRKKESQDKIEKIFLDLIQTKEINEISVTEICKKANLNRSTFYSNYIDIYDLADKIKEKLNKEVCNIYISNNIILKNNDIFLYLFDHIKNNQIFYKTYFKLEYDKKPFDDFYNSTLKNAHLYYNTDKLDYHIEFFRAGLNAIILKWLNNECKETPEEIYEIVKSEYKNRN